MYLCPCGRSFEKSKSFHGHKANCLKYNQYINEKLSYDFLYEKLVQEGYTSNNIVNTFFKNDPYINRACQIINRATKLGIKTPTIKESCNNPQTLSMRVNTCLSQYGTTNVLSKGAPAYNKRNSSVYKKYGVSNVFQLEEIKLLSELTYVKKYGISRQQHKRKTTKEAWERLTDDQKNIWLEKSLFSEKSIKNWKQCGCRTSKIEKRVEMTLIDNLIHYQHNFCITIGPRKRRYYDFLLTDTNILIEVNGDYWHANPLFYKENDLMHYFYSEVSAKDIWQRDLFKKKLAEDQGYRVIYVWENELKKSNTSDDIFKLLEDKIYENSFC